MINATSSDQKGFIILAAGTPIPNLQMSFGVSLSGCFCCQTFYLFLKKIEERGGGAAREREGEARERKRERESKREREEETEKREGEWERKARAGNDKDCEKVK